MPDLYQLHVVLRNISPLIWRRFLVRSDTSIAELHVVLQTAMGWSDTHLHRFRIHGKAYGIARCGGIGFADGPFETRLSAPECSTTSWKKRFEGGIRSFGQKCRRRLRLRPDPPVFSALHDLRGLQEALPAVYDPDPANYGAAQTLARKLRDKGSNGIVYDSVRDPGGECAAIFRPPVLSPVRQGPNLCYVWDGEAITSVYVKNRYEPGRLQ